MRINKEPNAKIEEGLDPLNWKEQRALGHRMMDDMFDFLEHIGEKPVWTKPSPASRASFEKPLPFLPQSTEEVYNEFRENILPYFKGNIHPRFWSWVEGTGTPFGMLADMLASAMNSNVTIGDHSAMYVDQQVLSWAKIMMGFPASSSGILVSGCSMANITAIQIARNSLESMQIRKLGFSHAQDKLRVYASAETHSCNQKAVEIAGLGTHALRKVPVNAAYQIELESLEQMMEEDRKLGLIPFCIIGNAGTVNTGAIDPLSELAAIAQKNGLWFHIDGAFGALACLVPEFKDQLKGLALADSLAFDFHKWMYMPYEAGCLLVKDPLKHTSSFEMNPVYLLSHERGLAAGPASHNNYGMELSRGFKALKIWMSIKEHGIEKYGRIIAQNIDQAFYLETLIKQEASLELLCPVSLNIVCYRYFSPDLNQEQLNLLNKEIVMRLHEEGIAAPSFTILHGSYAIRVAITNHRSRRPDFEVLVKESIRLGDEALKSLRIH